MGDAVTRALILSAGRGERLRPLTDDRPKCLVELAGRTLLDWQLAALAAAGIRDVAIVVGWQGARIRDPRLVRYANPHWRRTTMVASLLAASPWLARGPCIVAYGDVVYHEAIVRRLAEAPHDIAITYDRAWRALWDARFARPEEDAETLRVSHGHVVEIGGRVRDLGAVEGQFMGLLRLAPAGLVRIADLRATVPASFWAGLDMTGMLAALIRVGVEVGAVPVDGHWCEVDCCEDLSVYDRALRAPGGWMHDWRDVPT